MKKLLLVSALACAFAVPQIARADSNTVNPATTGSTASGKLNFSIIVPAVLYFRIGTGNGIGGANLNTTPDTIVFTVPATNLSTGTAVAGTGGDLFATTPGSVTVRLFSNVGNATGVTLSTAAGGQLTSGTDVIPWTEISITPAALTTTTPGFTNGSFAHPTLNNVGVGSLTTLPTLKVIRQEAQWVFGYKNTATQSVAAGTYGAGGGTNGVLTYTATQL